MMSSPNILLIEDDAEKLERVRVLVTGIQGISPDDITVVTTIKAARQQLSTESYDIMILDLNLPADENRQATPGSGLELLKAVSSSARYKRPRHVIFLTGFVEELANLRKETTGRSWSSILYDPTSLVWETELTQKLEYALSAEAQRDEISSNRDGELSSRQVLWLAAAIQLLCVGALWKINTLPVGISFLGVPIVIWQWSLIGAVTGVLYRLGFERRADPSGKLPVYIWAFAKPFVGTALGAIVYFIALCGVLILNGKAEIQNTSFLCALSFLASFSDRYSIQIINKFVGNTLSTKSLPPE